jgi:L-ascorbate metabolism protein UlaG (beta-lactamase superfamily)
MMPEETVQAAIDLKAKALMPVHWGKFKLGMHAWDEPVKRVTAKAIELNVPVKTPKIGEPHLINNSTSTAKWWEM